MKRFIIASLLAILMAGSYFPKAFAEGGKYLVVLQAGKETHEGMARAVHALLYSQELTAEYQGHPSIAKWADQGYQLVIL